MGDPLFLQFPSKNDPQTPPKRLPNTPKMPHKLVPCTSKMTLENSLKKPLSRLFIDPGVHKSIKKKVKRGNPQVASKTQGFSKEPKATSHLSMCTCKRHKTYNGVIL